jgi:hypothetical protein
VPKFNTTTALLEALELYIKAPLAVKLADAQDMLSKLTTPAVLDVAGVPAKTVRDLPPAEYAAPDVLVISPEDVYTVVLAPKVAELLYNAILNVCEVKSCTPSNNSFLKEVHIA